MAKVKITGIKQAGQNFKKFLNRSIQESDLLKDVGSTAETQIRNRTRARLEEYKQDDIRDSSKKRRKSLIKSGNAFNNAIVKDTRSNLSLSGQLLESIKHRIGNLQSLVILYLENNRKPYKGVKGQDLENRKTNTEIKNDLEKQGRFFLFISDKLKAQLESRIAQQLRKKLTLYNKIIRKLSR